MNNIQKNYILRILDEIKLIEEYTNKMSYDDFQKDKKTIDAVLMQFQHIGETFKKLKNKFPGFEDYPHKQVVGFRDIISHNYLGIDAKETWLTIKQDLPELKNALENNL